jgi:hypothetical protein
MLIVPAFSQTNPIRYSSKLPPAGWIRQAIFEDEIVFELPREFKKIETSLRVREYPFDTRHAAGFKNGSIELMLNETNQDFPSDESGVKLCDLIATSFPDDETIESGYFYVNGALMYYVKALRGKTKFHVRLFTDDQGKLFHVNVETEVEDLKYANSILQHIIGSLHFVGKTTNLIAAQQFDDPMAKLFQF